MRIDGEVVRGDDLYLEIPHCRTRAYDALTIWPEHRWQVRIACSYEMEDYLVTSAFLGVHLPSRRLFIDQSYGTAQALFPLRPRIAGGGFTLDTEPERVPGRTLVLGGPIDGVWYHWLFNWAPRMLLARHLRPEVLDDPDTRIAVHPLALTEPYRAILEAFGVPMARYLPLDPDADHLLERAVTLSFFDDERLFPISIQEMRTALAEGLGAVRRPGGRDRRIFVSRQALPPRRRRIANFAAVAPVLAEHGVRVVDMGACTARLQASVFAGADMVLGGHGSDLANILFCRPGTRVIVIENDHSVHFRLHRILQHACEMLGLRHSFLQTPAFRPEGRAPGSVNEAVNEDYLVDPDQLAAAIRAAA